MSKQEQLTRTSKILETIVWNQSHVIRRPLANILGLAMVLENMELNQNLRNVCTMLIESSKELDEAIKASARQAE
ncbi:hypothetical protein [Pontibacter harenae]|uniref:hypothetical protein n=1 Tax=Pontibacter harenae TaxID=2894083 RepID=UPI001E634F69|nr:hypothetical protein [Pontibacter harenae]MCC9169029.1 hypothetical protein [Pontibacter harenae]